MQKIRSLLLTGLVFISVKGMAQLPSALSKQLDSLLFSTPHTKLPGFAVRVLKDNEVLYQGETGFANITRKIPMGPSSVTNIGSVTKQFTAYAVFLLEERGKLHLKDDVHRYLPELPDFGKVITIEQLLSHTSGLRDYPDFISFLHQSYDKNLRYPHLLDFLSDHRELHFAPGEKFCYSNTGYMLLAEIIHRVSGMSYARFLQQEIFKPLHMSSTFVNEGIINEQADYTTSYVRRKNHPEQVRQDNRHRDALGATGVFSSINDLTEWNRLFYEHEAGIRPSSIVAKMERSFILNDGTPCNYGGGLLLKSWCGRSVVEHSGGWGEYMTQYRRFPKEGITILVLTNSHLDSPIEICDKISNMLLECAPKIHRSEVPCKVSMQLFNGTYLSEDNLVKHLVVDSLRNELRVYNGTRSHFTTFFGQENAGSEFRYCDSLNQQLVLTQTASGVPVIEWAGGNYFVIGHTYTQIPETGKRDYSGYAGKYYSSELNRRVTVRFNRRKNCLYYIPVAFKRFRLVAIGDNVLSMKGETYLVRFSEPGMTIGNDWIYNLTFVKEEHRPK